MFATHYLEEADANADRAVLMAHRRVVADGPTTEIKARVGTRTIRATLPGVPTDELSALAGVNSAERHGDAVILMGSDSDRAIRDLLELYPAARDIEITGAGLEDAFVQLTGDADSEAPGSPSRTASCTISGSFCRLTGWSKPAGSHSTAMVGARWDGPLSWDGQSYWRRSRASRTCATPGGYSRLARTSSGRASRAPRAGVAADSQHGRPTVDPQAGHD